jgi:hypothetical protein
MTISPSRSYVSRKTCTIRRVSVDANGETDLPLAHLSDVPCTAVMMRNIGAKDWESKREGSRASATENEVIVFGDYDIKRGDLLTVDGTEYSVTDVFDYRVNDPFSVVVIEDIQANKEADSVFVR